MGELTRQYDWSKTALGTPDQWPQSLRTTVGILLHSAFPTFLAWGRDSLICFYNDAFRPSLGDQGVHPAIGQSYPAVWPEVWDFVEPLFQQVLDQGQTVYFENQLVPIQRNGQLEEVYWTFSYSPAYDDTGEVNGVFVTCWETTNAVLAQQQTQASEVKFRSLIEEAPVSTCLFVGPELRIDVVNEVMLK